MRNFEVCLIFVSWNPSGCSLKTRNPECPVFAGQRGCIKLEFFGKGKSIFFLKNRPKNRHYNETVLLTLWNMMGGTSHKRNN